MQGIIQYGKKIDASIFKSCGEAAERGKCDSRKILKFSPDREDDIVTIKHYGAYSCSPLKPKTEKSLSKEIHLAKHVLRKEIY